jgi:hypothetical protein
MFVWKNKIKFFWTTIVTGCLVIILSFWNKVSSAVARHMECPVFSGYPNYPNNMNFPRYEGGLKKFEAEWR